MNLSTRRASARSAKDYHEIPVLSLLQDPANEGGTATVIEWYRRWMELHRQGGSVECYLAEDTAGFRPRRRTIDARGAIRIDRFLPKLHVPPYVEGRRQLRDLSSFDEVHVVGASCMHGYLSASAGSLVWFGTTIGDERASTMGRLGWARGVLHRASLPVLARIEREVLERAARIIAQSQHTASELIRGGISATKIEVLPVPIETDHLHPMGVQRHGVLFIGRAHDPRKGFDRLLRLAGESDRVRREGIDVISPGGFPMGLDGPTRESLRWHGSVADLAPFYAAASVFVLPSRQEGLGIVAFEALATATPVVAMSCGGPDAFLRESGGGVVVGSEAEFQSAVEALLGDPSRAEDMGAAGREWVEKNMSASAFLADGAIFTA